MRTFLISIFITLFVFFSSSHSFADWTTEIKLDPINDQVEYAMARGFGESGLMMALSPIYVMILDMVSFL